MIPVIDFSSLDGEKRTETLAQIHNGCEEWGFFQLVNHGIPVELLDKVKKVCNDSYKLREESFMSSDPVHKLSKLVGEEMDGKPITRLNDLDWEDVFSLQDDNEWPCNPLEFKEIMKEFREELKKLAEKLMTVMEENLGLPKGTIKNSFTNYGDLDPFFGTKVSHYPPCPRPDLVDGLRAHTDAGGIILLFQDDQVGGLEILKDNQWIDVQPLHNAIVINTGDQIEVLTNGRYKSTWHRVLATGDGNRMSIASFYNPAMKATIAPVSELVVRSEVKGNDEDGHGKRLYPGFVFGDYMDVYVKQKFLAKEPRFDSMAAV